jgi:hypothetical protein
MSLAHLIGNQHARKHGCGIPGKRTTEYQSWMAMRQRCLDPNFRFYFRYGGRGIKICARWDSFQAFLDDMGPKPSPEHELDRFPDNNGDYCPENCRWATKKEQARNRRTNHLLTFQGITLTIAEWGEKTGIGRKNIAARLRKGWSIEKALTTPKRRW